MNTFRKIGIPLLVLLLAGLSACRKPEPDTVPEDETPATGMPFTAFHTQYSSEDVTLGTDTVFLYRTQKTDYSQAVIHFETAEEGTVVTCDSTELVSGESVLDLSYPRTVITRIPDRSQPVITYIQATCRAKIPMLEITVGNTHQLNNSKDEQATTVTINPNGAVAGWALQTHKGTIRARGNSTYGSMPKKSYKIKFDESVGMLGARAHRDWVLLANYADKTQMRTRLAFEMGRALQLPYTPGDRFVEVYINGSYNGLYQLTDQVEVDGGGRVEARYLLEINERHTDIRTSRCQYSIEIEHPSDFSSDEKEEIEKFLTLAEASLYSADYQDMERGFRKYWDTDTAIKWAMVNELFKNSDAKSYASIFLYQKVRDGKLYWGPLWDFDLGAGNYGYSNQGNCKQNQTEGWYIFENKYFKRMYADNVWKARVKAVWAANREALWEIIQSIPDLQAELALPARYNRQKWPVIKDGAEYSNINLPDTDEGQVKFLKQWLENRWRWLDSQW
ncbi:MAG: CotH kinase family protein [Paludibacteraceae bacterium]|nr:CotH kinase family protein [Paludibacteraceae bacterium]